MGASGTVLVISGPSGCGKSTICRRLLADPRVEFSISATTRKPRKGEVDGREYHFVDEKSFRELVEKDAFVEWAEVHGALYGTLRKDLNAALEAGRTYLVEIDVQGGATLKQKDIPGVYVFVSPPDLETLRQRLVDRGTDAPDVIERRMKKATEEMERSDLYDHVVTNDDLDRATAEVRRLAGLISEEIA